MFLYFTYPNGVASLKAVAIEKSEGNLNLTPKMNSGLKLTA